MYRLPAPIRTYYPKPVTLLGQIGLLRDAKASPSALPSAYEATGARDAAVAIIVRLSGTSVWLFRFRDEIGARTETGPH